MVIKAMGIDKRVGKRNDGARLRGKIGDINQLKDIYYASITNMSIRHFVRLFEK